MKTTLWKIACTVVLAVTQQFAEATSLMRLSGDGGATWINVVDNGPLDVNPTAGFINYNGPVDGWTVNIVSAIGQPLAGTTNRPTIDVQTFNYSTFDADLIVQMSETGFTSLPTPQTYYASIIGTTVGTVEFETWRDNGNVLFGTTKSYPTDPPGISPSPTAIALTRQGPFTGGQFLDGTNVTVLPQLNSTYSITLQTTIRHVVGGNTRTDALFYSPLVIRCPNDIDLGCNPAVIPDCDPSQVLVDSADPASVQITCASTTTTNGCFRTRAITYTATDSSGSTVTCTHNVSWKVDTNAPVISELTNKTFQCDQPWIFDVPNASDNCDEPLLTIESTSTNIGTCGYTARQVWKATDLCGNASYATQTVVVADTTAPVITPAPDKIVQCSSEWMFDAPNATDNCGNVTIAPISTITNALACGFTATRVWSATDDCGNSVLATQVVSVVDTIAPTITCAPNKIVECGTAWTFNAPNATDNCGTPSVVIVNTVTNGTACNLEITRTWRASDSCGNSSECSQTVTIRDTTPPIITCAPDVLVTNCEPLVFCTYTPGGWGAPPNGNNPGMLLMNNFSTVYPAGFVEIGQPGGSGNSARFTSPLAIQNFLPNGGTPGALDQDLVDPLTTSAGVFAQHVLALTLNVDFSAAGITGNQNGPLGSVVFNDPSSPLDGKTVAQILVIANKLLGGGNANGFTIEDVSPVVDGINNAFDNCQTTGWANSHFIKPGCTVTNVPGAPTVSDACDPHPLVTFKDSSSQSGCGTAVVRTWYAVDACGNTNSCTQLISTTDNTPPVITCSPNKVVECGTAWTFDVPTATDNSGSVSISILTTVTNGTACNLNVTRTWSASDACGNSNTCSQTVTVRDTTPPTIVCVPNTTVTNCQPLVYCTYTPGGWGAPPNGYNPGMLLLNNFSTVYPNGSVEIGIPGNGGYSAKFTSPAAIEAFLPNGGTPGVLNSDSVNPLTTSAGVFAQHVLALTLNVNFSAAGITGTAGGPLGSVVFTDPSSPLNGKAIGQILAIANSLLGGGTVPGVAIGDVSSVVDSINNAFDNCQTTAWGQSHFVGSSCTVSNSPGTPTVSDTCDPHPLLTYKDSTTSGACGSTVIRTWYAVDSCGNTNSCTQQITTVDTTPPVITCSANKTVECGSAWSFDAPTATDNSGTANITIVSTVTNGTACSQTITRTWKATDACGNWSTCSQTVTVRDTTPPVITCPPNGSITNVEIICSYTPGGWGAPPNGNNIASVLLNNFTFVYSSGAVEIGIPGNSGKSLIFTSPAAIQAYLPDGGTPGPLKADATNPTTSSAGAFGSHVLALTLNVNFSDAGVIGGGTPLGALIYNNGSSALNGKSIRDILAIANTFLGGGFVTGTSLSEVHTLISAINEGFDNCQANGWAKSSFNVPSPVVPNGAPTAVDTCDKSPTVVFVDAVTNLNLQGVYTVTRTWKATDDCGNMSTCSQVLTFYGNPPSGLCATPASGSVTLKWNKTVGASSYVIKRSTSATAGYAVVKSGLTSTNYTDTAVANGTVYYYVVCAVKSSGATADSKSVPAAPGAALPKPWVSRDIGAVGVPGSSTYAAPKFNSSGSGVDIWNSADEFRYVYQVASGDCSIVARVASLGNTDPWAKAGVMIRETLTDNSRHASLFITPGNGAAFQSRSSTGGTSISSSATAPTAPYWVKLVRIGNTFTAYYSANGSTWTAMGSRSISMTSTVYIGLAVTSHNDEVLCTATFDGVTATP